MSYFINRVYNKETGKEVKFQDKVYNADGQQFEFMWADKASEVCVLLKDDGERFFRDEADKFGLVIKEIEMPTGYTFAIYTSTMLSDDEHSMEIYDVKFHGFIEIFTKKEVCKDVLEKVLAEAEDYALLKGAQECNHLSLILRRRYNSPCIISGKHVGVFSKSCAIRVRCNPHTEYGFDCTAGDKDLIECVKNNYCFFREQVSRANHRTAYPINLDEKEDE